MVWNGTNLFVANPHPESLSRHNAITFFIEQIAHPDSSLLLFWSESDCCSKTAKFAV